MAHNRRRCTRISQQHGAARQPFASRSILAMAAVLLLLMSTVIARASLVLIVNGLIMIQVPACAEAATEPSLACLGSRKENRNNLMIALQQPRRRQQLDVRIAAVREARNSKPVDEAASRIEDIVNKFTNQFTNILAGITSQAAAFSGGPTQHGLPNRDEGVHVSGAGGGGGRSEWREGHGEAVVEEVDPNHVQQGPELFTIGSENAEGDIEEGPPEPTEDELRAKAHTYRNRIAKNNSKINKFESNDEKNEEWVEWHEQQLREALQQRDDHREQHAKLRHAQAQDEHDLREPEDAISKKKTVGGLCNNLHIHCSPGDVTTAQALYITAFWE